MAHYLKSGVLSIFITLSAPSLLPAQQLLAENCSTGALPPGWTNTGLPNNQTWSFDNPGARQIFGVGFDASFAMLDSDHFGGGQIQDAYLTTPALDASGLANVWLVFSESFRSYPNSFHEILVSPDDGATWITVRKDF